MKKIFLSLSLALFLAACGSGPASQARKFSENAARGHTAEAVEQIDPAMRQIAGPKLIAAVEKSHKKASGKGGLKSAEVLNEQIDGDHATLDLKETYGDGTSNTTKMKMRQVEGTWYVTF